MEADLLFTWPALKSKKEEEERREKQGGKERYHGGKLEDHSKLNNFSNPKDIFQLLIVN